MTKLNDVPSRVVSGPVKRYDAVGQKNVARDYSDNQSLSAREMKFTRERPYHRQKPEATRARTEAKKRMASVKAVNVKKIKWEAVIGKPPYRIVNCLFLAKVVDRLVLDHPSLDNPLYGEMLERLKTPKFAVVTRFYIIETGEDKERVDELGTFIKVTALEEEFVLPVSFLWNCAQTFLKRC